MDLCLNARKKSFKNIIRRMKKVRTIYRRTRIRLLSNPCPNMIEALFEFLCSGVITNRVWKLFEGLLAAVAARSS